MSPVLERNKQKCSGGFSLRRSSPGEDGRAGLDSSTLGLLDDRTSLCQWEVGARSSGSSRQFGLARMPFHTASSWLLPPLRVFCKLSSSFLYSPHIQSHQVLAVGCFLSKFPFNLTNLHNSAGWTTHHLPPGPSW